MRLNEWKFVVASGIAAVLAVCGLSFGSQPARADRVFINKCGTPAPRSAELIRVERVIQSTPPDTTDAIIATIPVWVHVIRTGTTFAQGNVTDSMITRQIQQLNDTFFGTESGVDTKFRFVHAGTTRTTNAAWFNALPGTMNELAMKATLHRGGPETLNMYTNNMDVENTGLLGWARFPWWYNQDPPDSQDLDGVVVQFLTLPGGGMPNYDEGDTAVHEVGHWMGLLHTFQGGCSATGDLVVDTPAERSPNFGGCNLLRDSCTGLHYPGKDPVQNFMDYSGDSCLSKLTIGQATRMYGAWYQYRR